MTERIPGDAAVEAGLDVAEPDWRLTQYPEAKMAAMRRAARREGRRGMSDIEADRYALMRDGVQIGTVFKPETAIEIARLQADLAEAVGLLRGSLDTGNGPLWEAQARAFLARQP